MRTHSGNTLNVVSRRIADKKIPMGHDKDHSEKLCTDRFPLEYIKINFRMRHAKASINNLRFLRRLMLDRSEYIQIVLT
jgi:hypothetical protein